jgi:hypothetical protein
MTKRLLHAIAEGVAVLFGQRKLFANLGRDIPACPFKRRRDVFGADVAFGELLFVHASVALPHCKQQSTKEIAHTAKQNEGTTKTPVQTEVGTGVLWRWRESNPRPKHCSIKLPHSSQVFSVS